MPKKQNENLCARCHEPKTTFTKFCENCLHRARSQRYKSYGRDDLPEVMMEK